MATIAKLYPLLKEMGLNDEKSRDFIETIEDSYQGRIEQEIKHLVTKEDLLLTKEELRKDIANLKVDMIKWAIGLLLGQTALTLAVIRLFFIK